MNKKQVKVKQEEVDKFEEKKKKKAVEQQAAKREIDKKLVKKTYKTLEKDSDPIIVRLLETFVALLRNRPSAAREDTELYLRKYDGLLTAMNKVNPRNISGGNARIYTDNIKLIRNSFREEGEYVKYIPYLVFVNQTCSMVSLTVEEKQIEAEIHELEEDTKAKEKEIDEIETFREMVDEVIDYEDQVEQEKKQLNLLNEHYKLLQLRMKKLNKSSKFFQKYFFRDITDKKRLRSKRIEKIDTMDDLDNLENIDERIQDMNLEGVITRIAKDDKDHNPLGKNNERRPEPEERKQARVTLGKGSARDEEEDASKNSDDNEDTDNPSSDEDSDDDSEASESKDVSQSKDEED